MNLDDNPAPDQLAKLLATCDSNNGRHINWIDYGANVRISLIPEHLTTSMFQTSKPDMKVRFETIACGSNWVGAEAASDVHLVEELFEYISKKWDKSRDYSGDGVLRWPLDLDA